MTERPERPPEDASATERPKYLDAFEAYQQSQGATRLREARQAAEPASED